MDSGERSVVDGSERAPVATGTALGPSDPSAVTTVTVYLRRRPGAPAEDAFDDAGVARLTREELAERLGASADDVDAVLAFAADAGLGVVETDRGRRSVVLRGTVGDLAAAFGTEIVDHRDATGATYRARSGPLTVPAGLAPSIAAVVGLDERPQAETRLRRPDAAATGATSYTPVQVAALYDFPTGGAAGQTVGIVELGGGYAPADLTAYFAALGVTEPTVTAVSVDGGANTPGGAADAEVMLDIEVVGAVAPGAHIAVYFAPNTDQGFVDAVTTAVHDTTNHPSVVSISWGGSEDTWTAQTRNLMEQAFVDAAALGVTVTVAAGDGGSTDGQTDGRQHVDFPASAPHALACGGTSLQASGATITAETVWNDGASGGATGGGISDAFAVPSYQAAVTLPASANAGAGPGRGVPDVSGDADPQTGYQVRVDGRDEVIGGTSAVAPLWAGLVALLNARGGAPVGFLQPRLYALAAGQGLRDITSGTNGAYAAGPGWDACTGLGSPVGAALAQALAAGTPTAPPTPTPPAPAPPAPAPPTPTPAPTPTPSPTPGPGA